MDAEMSSNIPTATNVDIEPVGGGNIHWCIAAGTG